MLNRTAITCCHASPPMRAEPPSFTATDWNDIPFDVCCNRCGADLRRCSESRCPRCGLELNWQSLLPVQNLRCLTCEYRLVGLSASRCPECGTAIDWDEALSVARRQGFRRLVEYAWRTKPVTSLAYTWVLAAFRPRALWSNYSIHDAPHVVPLILFALFQWLLFAFSWHLGGALADWGINELAALTNRGLAFNYQFRLGRDFFARSAVWYVATFLCFQLFVTTKRRYAIRWPQMLRVYVHSTAILSLGMLASLLVEVAIDGAVLFNGIRVPLSTYMIAQDAVLIIAMVATSVHIAIGFHSHLRVRRGWGMGVLCIVLGNLLTRAVFSIT
jgi:hypothetical protein